MDGRTVTCAISSRLRKVLVYPTAAPTSLHHRVKEVKNIQLDFGGQVVDTPGMREFGLWQFDDEELAHAFVEMRPYLGACKFGVDCTHDHEPGCAVKAAVEAGAISPRRYQSYLRLRGEVI